MKERIVLWDNIKFILITLVVIGHLADEFTINSNAYKSIFLFIYSFHMPAFIFISGLFHNEKNILKKCIFYSSIGFLYKIISLVIDRLSGNINVTFSLLSDGGVSWFMFVLAIYTVITYLIRNENKKYILVSSIFLACFVGYDKYIGDFLYLSRSIVFFPFYLLGTMVKSEDIIKIKSKNKILFIFAILIVLIWGFLCFYKIDTLYILRYLFTGRNAFYEPILKYGAIARLFSYIISFLLLFSIIILVPSKNNKFISPMGENSIYVYFWHWKFYMLLEEIFVVSRLFYIGVFGKILFLLIGVVISIILSQGGIFSFPIKQIKKYCFN